MEIRIDEIGVGAYRFFLLALAPSTGPAFDEVLSDAEERLLFASGSSNHREWRY